MSGSVTPGRRVYDLAELTQPGDYLLRDSTNPDGAPRGFSELWFRLPTGGGSRHIHDGPNGWTFTENADGTVTANPSIQTWVRHTDGTDVPGWHGYLADGEWREC